MLRYEIYFKEGMKNSAEIIATLDANSFFVRDSNCQVLIVVGGDGTLLDAIKNYPKVDNFILLNAGNVGHYADYEINQIDEFISDATSNSPTSEKFSLLEVNAGVLRLTAINEIRIESPLKTIKAEILISGQYLETYSGNGLIISSVFGSTGYNKSLGGAIVDSSLDVLQLTEIAPINNLRYKSLNSPLIIAAMQTISIKIISQGNYILGADRYNEEISAEEVIIKKSQREINLIHYHENRFFYRINKTFTK